MSCTFLPELLLHPHEGASRSFFLLILVIDPFKARGSAQSTGERGLGY